ALEPHAPRLQAAQGPRHRMPGVPPRRPRGRRLGLRAQLHRPDPRLHPPHLHRPRHRRLRPLRHPRQPAPPLRSGPLLHRPRSDRRAGEGWEDDGQGCGAGDQAVQDRPGEAESVGGLRWLSLSASRTGAEGGRWAALGSHGQLLSRRELHAEMAGVACCSIAGAAPFGEQNMVTRDSDVRAALMKNVISNHLANPSTLVVEEFGLDRGGCRVDVAVLNGLMHGYEIKSDADTLARLPSQVTSYSAVLDKATLVVGACHVERALELVPNWWGIRVVRTGSRGAV